jgi:hypothetical protein
MLLFALPQPAGFVEMLLDKLRLAGTAIRLGKVFVDFR